MSCPVCAADDWHPVLRASDLRYRAVSGEFVLARCRACGLHSLQPPPDPDVLRAAYPRAYGPHAGPTSDAPGRDRLSKKWSGVTVRPGLRVLDVGCGAGRDLERLRRLGAETWGVEPEDRAAAAARALGLRVHTGTIHDAPHPPPRFDLVSLVHVIEHVPDPVPTLRRAAELLAAGGCVLVLTPNVSSWTFRLFRKAWYPLDAPRHLNLFSRASLEAACGRAGLAVARLSTRPHPRIIRASLDRTEWRRLARFAQTGPGRLGCRLLSWLLGGALGMGEELVLLARRAENATEAAPPA